MCLVSETPSLCVGLQNYSGVTGTFSMGSSQVKVEVDVMPLFTLVITGLVQQHSRNFIVHFWEIWFDILSRVYNK